MRTPLLLAAICLFYSIFLYLPLPKGAAYPAPGLAETVIAFLYAPVMLTAGTILISGIICVFRKKDRQMWILSCLMCLPLCISLGVGVASRKNRNKSKSWSHIGMYLRDRLMEYYEIHPERFHYIGEDEEINVDGFGDYVNSKKSGFNSRYRSYVRMRAGKVLDPWGKTIRLGRDRDHDGYISIAGRDVSTDHVSPPRLDYQVALVVILGDDYGNGIGPQIARK